MRRKLAHAVALTATWLAASSPANPLATPLDAGRLAPDPPPTSVVDPPIVPFESRSRVNLDAVYWTAPRSESLKDVAERFGLKAADLRKLDPSVGPRVEAGQRVLVYRHMPGTVSRSIGAPNRGRMEHGAPLPEGEGWKLRAYRPRTWATRHVITELATALADWRERFPDAQPVLLGELARPRGGRARPHKSHRTGRDVDLGYVLLEPPNPHRFTQATPATLDAAATWGLVERLLASGSVESIFMAGQVQAQILPYAMATTDPSRLVALFSVLATNPREEKKAIIRAWGGHDDHMHIRFACIETDTDCRAPKTRRRGKKKGKKRRT